MDYMHILQNIKMIGVFYRPQNSMEPARYYCYSTQHFTIHNTTISKLLVWNKNLEDTSISISGKDYDGSPISITTSLKHLEEENVIKCFKHESDRKRHGMLMIHGDGIHVHTNKIK